MRQCFGGAACNGVVLCLAGCSTTAPPHARCRQPRVLLCARRVSCVVCTSIAHAQAVCTHLHSTRHCPRLPPHTTCTQGDAIVRVTNTCICGSDLHLYLRGECCWPACAALSSGCMCLRHSGSTQAAMPSRLGASRTAPSTTPTPCVCVTRRRGGVSTRRRRHAWHEERGCAGARGASSCVRGVVVVVVVVGSSYRKNTLLGHHVP
jgi:hypothetical protein